MIPATVTGFVTCALADPIRIAAVAADAATAVRRLTPRVNLFPCILPPLSL